MGKINILDKAVSEKIAAGEVVERPASVVKELVENSFDSGATSVTVEIERGGITYIRVTDNGCGIEKDDTARAFARHGTSKITSEFDLERISTLGFRGEALCSISAVSRTELITKTQDESLGTRMLVEGGETVDFSEAGCPDGTTVTVKNLFFNTPARMKFLKKDNTETSYVTDICQRAALSHPEVSFRYLRDGREIFFTPGDNSLLSAVRALFGNDIANNMTEVSYQDGAVSLSGLTGKNNLARPNRNMQFFFVNERLVKSQLLSLALTEAYKNELMIGKFPVCMLNIKIPPEMVDVNVHPSKTEVKFSNDEEIYRVCALGVRSALTQTARPREVSYAAKAFTLPVESKKALQTVIEQKPTVLPIAKEKQKTPTFVPIAKEEQKSPTFVPIAKEKQNKPVFEKREVAKSPEELPIKKVESLKVSEERAEVKPPEEKNQFKMQNMKVIGQAFSTYIIVQKDDEMIIIDQHAAHERINYEKIKNQGAMKQMLMMPLTVNLTAQEKTVWEQNKEFFNTLGFSSDDFGLNSVIVRTLPSDIDFDDGEALFVEVANSLMGQEKGETSERRDKAIYTVACKAAIKANYELSMAEMEKLAETALTMEGITTCPHGRPISISLTKYRLEKLFKRIV